MKTTFPLRIVGFDIPDKDARPKLEIDQLPAKILRPSFHLQQHPPHFLQKKLPTYRPTPRHATLSARAEFESSSARSDAFADKPAGTAAIMADGSYVVASGKMGTSLAGHHEFHLYDKNAKSLGKYDATVIETTDSVALTWIEKGDTAKKGATDFILWYLAKHTSKPFIEVRNILNNDLSAFLSKWHFSDSDKDDNLRGSTEKVVGTTQNRLRKSSWTLSE